MVNVCPPDPYKLNENHTMDNYTPFPLCLEK